MMITRLCASALLTLLVAGCSYYDNPLTTNPSKDLNTWLLGVWEARSEDGDVFRAGVLPLTGDKYTVWVRKLARKKKESKEWQFEGWISRVGDSRFLTLRCDASDGEVPVGAFVFAHYQVIDQLHTITRPLQIDLAQDATSYQLRVEVRRKLKEQTLLPAEGPVWTRISEVYWPIDGEDHQPMQKTRFPADATLPPPATDLTTKAGL